MNPILLIEIVSRCIDVVRKCAGATDQLDANPHDHADRLRALGSLIEQPSQVILEKIRDSARFVTEKIEQDELERLGERLRNLQLLIRDGDIPALRQYVLTVRESVGYARNRYREEKVHWFLPYITGLSLVAAAFRCLGKDDNSSVEEIKRATDEMRERALDSVIVTLVETGLPIPWDAVKPYLNGEPGSEERLLRALPNLAGGSGVALVSPTPAQPKTGAAIRCPKCKRMYQLSNGACPYCAPAGICPKCRYGQWYNSSTGYCSNCHLVTGIPNGDRASGCDR